MKAAVLYEVNQPLVIEDVSLPKPGPREVLIRTAVAGLCHSDLHFMEGLYPHPLPAVLGHESAGIVEQVGSDVTYVKPGDGGADQDLARPGFRQADILDHQRLVDFMQDGGLHCGFLVLLLLLRHSGARS